MPTLQCPKEERESCNWTVFPPIVLVIKGMWAGGGMSWETGCAKWYKTRFLCPSRDNKDVRRGQVLNVLPWKQFDC